MRFFEPDPPRRRPNGFYWYGRWIYGRYFPTIADACLYAAKRCLLMHGTWGDHNAIRELAQEFSARWSGNPGMTDNVIWDRCRVWKDEWYETDPLPPPYCRTCLTRGEVTRRGYYIQPYKSNERGDYVQFSACKRCHRKMARRLARLHKSVELGRFARWLLNNGLRNIANGVYENNGEPAPYDWRYAEVSEHGGHRGGQAGDGPAQRRRGGEGVRANQRLVL
jgi:hypothetical protein